MGHHNKIPKKIPFCFFSDALISFYLKLNRFQKDVVVLFRVETLRGIVKISQIRIRTLTKCFNLK